MTRTPTTHTAISVDAREGRFPAWVVAGFVAVPFLVAVPAEADVIFGQVQSTFTKDGSPHTVCLGVSGNPSAGAELMAVACDAPAPVWSVNNWKADGTFKVAYGPLGDNRETNASVCLDVDTAHPKSFENAGLYFCHPSTGANTDWSWGAQGSGTSPDQQIILNSNKKCLVPDLAGTELEVGPCSGVAAWTMLPSPQLQTVDGTIQHTRADSTKVCLDTDGPPVAGARVIGGDCANGDPWHVKTWAPSSPVTRIGYGAVDDNSGLCLSVPSARPGAGAYLSVETCTDVTDVHGLFNWGAEASNSNRPTTVVQLLSGNACIVPIQEGEPAIIQTCNDQTQQWTLGPVVRRGNPVETIFISAGTFTADTTATYRVFAIGGGGGGGYDEGAGGGSGRVAYEEIDLTDGDTVAVTIGAGGYAGTSGANKDGGDGAATTFGTHLTATGGDGGGKNNANGGNGGSGGGGDPGTSSVDGGAGGQAGGPGGHGHDNIGGTGQGESFTEHLCKIIKVDLTPGAGGTTNDRNASGGGGGGGITVGSETTGALANPADTARGGMGYGGGGAGGYGAGASSGRFGSAGASGLLIVERGGSPPSTCR